jgi:hypothetical protein
LAVLDRNATHLVHSNPQLIGKDFFGEYTQDFTGHNEDLNDLMKKVLSGESGDVVYTIGLGERLTTGFPISIREDNETGDTTIHCVYCDTHFPNIFTN